MEQSSRITTLFLPVPRLRAYVNGLHIFPKLSSGRDLYSGDFDGDLWSSYFDITFKYPHKPRQSIDFEVTSPPSAGSG